MADIITYDFETYYETRKPAERGPDEPRHSLSNLTYEEYLYSPHFRVHGVAIKVNAEPAVYYPARYEEPLWGLAGVLRVLDGNIGIAHNAMFDAAILCWLFDIHPARHQCTMWAARAVWPHSKVNLAAVARRLWPEDPALRKGDALIDTAGKWVLSAEEQTKLGVYACQDVELTFAAYSQFYRWLPDEELDLIDLTVRMFAEPGFVLDRERVLAYQRALNEELEAAIAACGQSRSTLSSNTRFAALVEELTGEPCPLKASPTPTNPENITWALAKDDLEFLELQERFPEHQALWRARLLVKGTGERSRCERLLAHQQPDGRIALPLNYYAAHTGRFGGANKVNPQNFKRRSELRRSLRAPKGYVVMAGDLSQIEPRGNAWFSEDQVMLAQFADPTIDIYDEFGSDIYARQIRRKHKELTPEGEERYPDEVEGFIAKTGVLSLGYQMGARGFRLRLATGEKRLLIALEQAQTIVRAFRTKYWGIAGNWLRMERLIFDMAAPQTDPYEYGPLRVERRRLRLPNGLYLSYPKLGQRDPDDPQSDWVYWNGKYMAKLYGGKLTENIVQALAQIVLKEQMLAVERDLAAEFPGSDARVLLQVHDEIIALVPERHAEGYRERMLELMRTPPAWCNDGRLVLDAEVGFDYVYSK